MRKLLSEDCATSPSYMIGLFPIPASGELIGVYIAPARGRIGLSTCVMAGFMHVELMQSCCHSNRQRAPPPPG
jgi:hypothetical protein